LFSILDVRITSNDLPTASLKSTMAAYCCVAFLFLTKFPTPNLVSKQFICFSLKFQIVSSKTEKHLKST